MRTVLTLASVVFVALVFAAAAFGGDSITDSSSLRAVDERQDSGLRESGLDTYLR